MENTTPTAKLYISDAENAVEEILDFADKLTAEGRRPWFEVFYPAPVHLNEGESQEWLAQQDETYDAVEVIDGEIVTLPPYAELEGGN